VHSREGGGVKGPIKFTQVGGTTGVGGTKEYCLDVSGSVKEGATVKATQCHGGDDQLWMFNQNEEGRIQVGRGKFLCLTQRKKADPDNLDQLYLSKCVPKEKLQTWSFNNHPNKKTGQMRRVKNAGSAKCLGLRYATDHNGGKAVTEWSCGKAAGQALQMCNDNEKPGCSRSSLLETKESWDWSSMSCTDDANFVDAAGYKCTAWSISTATPAGSLKPCDTVQRRMAGKYKIADLEAVQNSCQKSCEYCSTVANKLSTVVKGCEDTAGYTDEKGKTCSQWASYSCDKASTHYKYSNAGTEALMQNCRSSCQLCNDESLKLFQEEKAAVAASSYSGSGDNAAFKDAKGYGCGSWAVTGCEMVSPGYTISQMRAIQTNCPATCP